MGKLSDTLFHRSGLFLLSAVFLLGVAVFAAPQLFGVTVYKIGLVFASASAGYWIDRVTFPYARPDKIILRDGLVNSAMLRRSIIMAACMICVGLGA